MTKLLLGAIAAGIWTLVLLNGVTASRLAELNAEVKAIGLDTEQIHEDLDPGGDDEASSGKTRNGDRRGNAAGPNAAHANRPDDAAPQPAAGAVTSPVRSPGNAGDGANSGG